MKHLILLSVLLVMDSFAVTVFTAAVPSEGGSVSGGGVFAEDVSDAEVEAFPSAGYAFAGWYLDDECKNPVRNSGVGGYRQNPIHVDPRGNPTLYAKFIPPSEIHVEACALPVNGGLVESVDAGGQTTFTAIPNAGYKFAGWFLDTGCHTIFSTDNYLKNPLSCNSSTNVVLNAKFVQTLPSWVAGKWIGSLDFHRHGGEKVGDTATFDCDVDENGWWNSTCVWVNMGTRIVEATATNIINVTSTEVKIEGYYYSSDRFVWEMTLRIDGQSTFRAVRVENGNDTCEGVCEKMVPMGPKVPSWVEGVWTGSLATAEFTCDISSNGAWKAICKWENIGTMIVSATSTNIIGVADGEVSISGYYYCGNRFDWVMDLRQDGESSFRATKTGDSDSMFGTLSKEVEHEAQFSYYEQPDGSVVLFGVVGSVPAELVIPSEYGGRRVFGVVDGFCKGEEDLQIVRISEGVSHIGMKAFSNCTNIERVYIPATVANIGERAFTVDGINALQGLRKLKEIVVASGNDKYYVSDGVLIDRCNKAAVVALKAVTSVEIPGLVTNISSRCFSGCVQLTNVTFGVNVEVVGQEAFLFCRKLKTVDILGSKLRVLSTKSFSGCDSLQEIDLPETLTAIYAHAFRWCNSLQKAVFRGNAPTFMEASDNESSSQYVFITNDVDLDDISSGDYKSGWRVIDSVVVYVDKDTVGWGSVPGTWQGCPIQYIGESKKPDGGPYEEVVEDVKWTFGVKNGGACVGYGWKYPAISDSVTGSIEIPSQLGERDVVSLAVGAFFKKSNLTGVTIPSTVTNLEEAAFEHCSELLCMSLPERLLNIGDYAFHNCSKIESITIPDAVKSVGACAFQECTKLEIVNLSSQLEVIGSYAFKDCSGLAAISVPASVTHIGENAFLGCNSLNSIVFEGAPPVGVTLAAIKTDAAIRYNVVYESDWLSVIQQCGWTNATSYQPLPSVPGDPGAVATYDPENGYSIRPSAENVDVVVSIPSGVLPDKVTVEVGTNVESVKPNGANVKIVKGGNDITSYLDIPSADPNGTIDLTQTTVKSEIVKEAIDPDKGAKIELNAESPLLTTSETKPGLTYTLHEGATLQGMNPGDSKLGDGQPWTPNITVKGGTSGFYTISVEK